MSEEDALDTGERVDAAVAELLPHTETEAVLEREEMLEPLAAGVRVGTAERETEALMVVEDEGERVADREFEGDDVEEMIVVLVTVVEEERDGALLREGELLVDVDFDEDSEFEVEPLVEEEPVIEVESDERGVNVTERVFVTEVVTLKLLLAHAVAAEEPLDAADAEGVKVELPEALEKPLVDGDALDAELAEEDVEKEKVAVDVSDPVGEMDELALSDGVTDVETVNEVAPEAVMAALSVVIALSVGMTFVPLKVAEGVTEAHALIVPLPLPLAHEEERGEEEGVPLGVEVPDAHDDAWPERVAAAVTDGERDVEVEVEGEGVPEGDKVVDREMVAHAEEEADREDEMELLDEGVAVTLPEIVMDEHAVSVPEEVSVDCAVREDVPEALTETDGVADDAPLTDANPLREPVADDIPETVTHAVTLVALDALGERDARDDAVVVTLGEWLPLVLLDRERTPLAVPLRDGLAVDVGD